mgnify:CR=1 FL=1
MSPWRRFFLIRRLVDVVALLMVLVLHGLLMILFMMEESHVHQPGGHDSSSNKEALVVEITAYSGVLITLSIEYFKTTMELVMILVVKLVPFCEYQSLMLVHTRERNCWMFQLLLWLFAHAVVIVVVLLWNPRHPTPLCLGGRSSHSMAGAPVLEGKFWTANATYVLLLLSVLRHDKKSSAAKTAQPVSIHIMK